MRREPRKLNSGLMTGWVRHRRHAPTRHAFSFPLCMLYLDLDEIDAVFAGRLLWSATRAAPIRFRRDDYLVNDDPAEPLDAAVRRRVRDEIGDCPPGPVCMLAIPRTLGVGFNPVSFYFCFDADGRTPRAIVAEITNTPWLERFAYVLPIDDPQGRTHRWSMRKRFHISPFMPMTQSYTWTFSNPPSRDGGRLGVSMRSDDGATGEQVFDATLALRRRPLTAASRAACMLGYPAMNLQVLAAIYAHAGILRLKGTPFYPHPRHDAPHALEER